MAALAAYVRNRQHGGGAQCLLNAKAELVNSGLFVIVGVNAGYVQWQNRKAGCAHRRTVGDIHARIRKGDVVQVGLQVERRIHSAVIHVITLDAFVHDSETAAENRLALTGEVISKSDTRSEIGPMVVD